MRDEDACDPRNPWGEAISVDTRSAVPAGWYNNPDGSGGKRWWNGVSWTSNVQADAPATVPAAATAPAMAPPSGPSPYALPAPTRYGNAAEYVPFSSANTPNPNYNVPYVPSTQAQKQHNSAAVWPLVLGIIAFCISLVGLMPGSTVYFYSTTGIFAIIGGARALALRRKGYGTLFAAPLAAIILGSLAIVCMIAGVAVHAVPSSYDYGTPGAASQGDSGTSGASGSAGAPVTSTSVMPAPPTFATDPKLTAYAQSAATISKAIYDTYNGGQLTTDTLPWPSTLSVLSGGRVMFPSGTLAATIPSDEIVTYFLQGNHFVVEVTGHTVTDTAIYGSGNNQFAWVCNSGSGTTCPNGGLMPTPSPAN